MLINRHEIAVSIALPIVLLVCWMAFAPALTGPFLLDDYHNIGAMEHGVDSERDLREFLFSPGAGPTQRPVARLSFLIDDNAWPTSPFGFKRTNLLIHLLCGVLVFCVIRAIVRIIRPSAPAHAEWIGLAVATVWLLHPFTMSTVMYPVQRMAQLAALFSLCACLIFITMRPLAARGRVGVLIGMSLGIGIFGTLGLFSKENAAALVFLICAIEFTIFGSTAPARLYRAWRLVFLIAPAVGLAIYLAWIPNWLPGYEWRDFSLAERLMTQPVILVEYLYRILSFRTFGIGTAQDDQIIRTSLADPAVVGSLLLLTGLLVAAIRGRAVAPGIALGILWFLGGHAIEASTLSLELYFDHRNYLPMVGPILVGLLAIDSLARRNIVSATLTNGLICGLVLIAGVQTRLLAAPWGSANEYFLLQATEHPESPRATRTLLRWMEYFLQHQQALDIIDREFPARYPRDLSFPLISVDISCNMGMPYRYDLSEIAENIGEYDFTDGVDPTVQSLHRKLAAGNCPELEAPLATLLERTPQLRPRTSSAPKRMAKVLRMNATRHIALGQFDDARRNLHAAFELYPRAPIAFEITRFWMRAGNYESALAWLEHTEMLEKSTRHPLRPDLTESFAEKREMLRKSIDARRKNAEFSAADTSPTDD